MSLKIQEQINSQEKGSNPWMQMKWVGDRAADGGSEMTRTSGCKISARDVMHDMIKYN